MTDGYTTDPRTLIDVATWLDVVSRDALDLIVESVSEMAGFQVAAISAVRGDQMITVSAAGQDGVAERLIGAAAPVEAVLAELALGDDWGRFRYIPVDRQDPDLAEWTWTPSEGTRLDGPDAWDVEDLCMAPLRGAEGRLIGMLSIDVPLTGRHPSPSDRVLLDRYATQAERAVRMALERALLAERVRLAETAREVVRLATSRTDLDKALEACRQLLLQGYRADFLAIRAYATPGFGETGAPRQSLGGRAFGPLREAVRRCWTARRVATLSEQDFDDRLVDDEAARDAVLAQFASLDIGVAMVVPIGSRDELLGHLILGRKDPDEAWQPEEQSAILEIAGDIGQAVRNARMLAREQELSTYKTELLSTVSHELKNPLGVIAGHLELLDGAPELSAESQFSVSAMGRATRRVTRVVDDLLLLSQVEDPSVAVTSTAVDLGLLVDEALELTRFAAQQRNLTIRVELPDHPVFGCGDAAQLDRVLTNLLSNAVKYTPRDRSITISVAEHPGDGEVELAVADQGIGISEDDQAELFTEFFRSTNPRALAQPGTGLGLAICARILARHDGRIEVESKLGEGSTFRVFLPRPTED